MATTSKAVVGNIEIDIAPLVVVSLKCLFEKDEDELLKLYKAAESPGFFYLDVRDSEQYVADIQRMYAITERYFSEPEVVKMRDFVKDDEFRGWVNADSVPC